MKIDVRHTAKLAKLWLNENEIADFEKQMNEILRIVETLPELPDDGFLLDPENVMSLRPDIVEPSLSRSELLANAPQKQAGCIVVPKTLKEGI
ncbi:MAG: Asp-tRNA(Asn)/Glu-tRNA(Gln) amidotransferase subunit GatC [Oscillospiraceae bacterium]|nr:Asp-tRNA(Asn)/Glu-tRNA(Gln) amidotransferase subunit GatC [Oscillospiraceae bacterium]